MRRSRGLPSICHSSIRLSLAFQLVAAAIVAGPVVAERGSTEAISVAGLDLRIAGDLQGFTLKHKTTQVSEGVEILSLEWTAPTPATPPELSLEWSLPSHDIAGFWSVTTGYRKTVNASWAPSRVRSMLARSAPVFALFGHDDQNRLNVAVSDAISTVEMSCGLMEEDGNVHSRIRFFTEQHRKLSRYQVQIRFDRRQIPLHSALQEVPDWWASFVDYAPAPVPDIAREPMYSTWYSYHQNVSAEALLKEAKIARQLGFKAIIIDDGWQTLDSNRGYAFTGDWRPERIPEMKKFVQALHDLDMKVLLWYAVPFMGEKAKGYERFKGKYLRYWDGQGAYVLDPRYPEVREYIIDIYRQAIREWNLDGFKLDFIARFTADEQTVLEAAEGRDFASVNAATDRLMTDIMAELRQEKPDVMIEFRQPYVGPLMRKYGNIFRVGDCPNVAVRNRIGSIDLRLLSGDTAVHSDMIMWHYQEKVEVAALQFLNIIFSVPQVSVRLEDIPRDHFQMVKFLTRYWSDNRELLLDGELRAHSPLANYPTISARSDNKQILAVYEPQVISIDPGSSQRPQLDIVNAKLTETVVIDVESDLGTYQLTTVDCMGNTSAEQQIALTQGLHRLSAPAAGIIMLRPTS